MNRRTSLKLLTVFSLSLVSGAVGADKKKKNNNKKNNNNKKKNNNDKKNNDKKNEAKVMKLTGEIILSEEDITKVYQIKSGKLYSFSRSVEGKIQEYVGQKVTVQCKVADGRVIAIETVTAMKKS